MLGYKVRDHIEIQDVTPKWSQLCLCHSRACRSCFLGRPVGGADEQLEGIRQRLGNRALERLRQHVRRSRRAPRRPCDDRHLSTCECSQCLHQRNGRLPGASARCALQAVANAAAKVSTKAGAAVDVSGGLTTSVVQLAGRTQTVLIARDAFTANCVLAMNGFIAKDAAQTNFKETLKVIQTIANADKIAADADATKAKTEQVKVALAASGSSDPKVAEALRILTTTVDTSVDTVMKAVSNGQGVLLLSLATKFFGQNDVQVILTPNVAQMLGKQTDGDALRGLLNGVFFQYAEALAALARNFKE